MVVLPHHLGSQEPYVSGYGWGWSRAVRCLKQWPFLPVQDFMLSVPFLVHALCSWEPSSVVTSGSSRGLVSGQFWPKPPGSPLHLSLSSWVLPLFPNLPGPYPWPVPALRSFTVIFISLLHIWSLKWYSVIFFLLAFLDSWRARSQARGKTRYALQWCRNQRR